MPDDWRGESCFTQDEDRWEKRESFRASFITWHNNARLVDWTTKVVTSLQGRF